MKNNQKIDKIFEDWGANQKALPQNNDILKNKSLAGFDTKQVSCFQKPIKFLRFSTSFALAGFALFFLAVYLFNSQTTLNSTSSSHNLNYQSDQDTAYEVSKSTSLEPASTITSEDLGIAYGSYTSLGSGEPSRLSKVINNISRIVDDSPITDTREFLKVDYNLTAKLRPVQKKAQQIGTIIRGFGGRIDSSSINTRYARIEFVLPKSSLEKFKTELKDSLDLNMRFIQETESAQNLLSNKQVIEKNIDFVSSTLVSLKQQSTDLTNSHNATVAGLKQQLSHYDQQIYWLNQQKQKTTSTERLAEISSNLSYWYDQKYSVNKFIEKENASYTSQLSVVEQEINKSKTQQTSLNTQDQKLIDTTNTVRGSITLQWISVYKIIDLYIPHLWGWIVLVAFMLIVLLSFGRKRSIPSW